MLAAEVAAAVGGAVVARFLAVSADGTPAVATYVGVERRAFGLAGAVCHFNARVRSRSAMLIRIWQLSHLSCR